MISQVRDHSDITSVISQSRYSNDLSDITQNSQLWFAGQRSQSSHNDITSVISQLVISQARCHTVISLWCHCEVTDLAYCDITHDITVISQWYHILDWVTSKMSTTKYIFGIASYCAWWMLMVRGSEDHLFWAIFRAQNVFLGKFSIGLNLG